MWAASVATEVVLFRKNKVAARKKCVDTIAIMSITQHKK
jgi:hypothetical protein